MLHRPILRLVFGAIDADVMRMCETYFIITAVSYPFIGLYNAGTALFRVQGNSRISMFASLVMSAINIAGNAVLIYGLKIGVLGAATATLTGRIFAAVWVYTRQQHSDNPLRITEFALLRPQKNLICRIAGAGCALRVGKQYVSDWQALRQQSGFHAGYGGHCGQRCGKHGQQYFYPAGHDHQHCNDPGSGALSGGREQKQAHRYARLLMLVACGGLAVFNLVLYAVIPEITQLFSLSAAATESCIQVVRASISSAFFSGEPALHCRTPCAAAATPVLRWQSAF